MKKSPLRRIFKWIGILMLIPLLYVVGVIVLATATDYSPPPEEKVSVTGTASPSPLPDTLSLISWNVGYGAQGDEMDFFYDGGETVHMPKPYVEKCLKGIASEIAKYKAETDFFLLQEVDLDASRSHHINEVAFLSEGFSGFANSFAANYKVKFIPIPFLEPLGGVHGGLNSWLRYQPLEAMRFQFEGNYNWPTSLFFLDRCFLLHRFAVDSSEKELWVINTHNSAYDDGSLKARQLAQLKTVIQTAYENGHYVIVGGDWNQFPPGFEGVEGFSIVDQPRNRWIPVDYPAPDWQWAADYSVATNRSLAAAYDPDTTRRGVIDYFLLSPNVKLLEVKGIDHAFAYSDHQAVRVKVALNRGIRE